MKKLLLGVLVTAITFSLNACSTTSKDTAEKNQISGESKEERKNASQKELEEILEKTIPDKNKHFNTTSEGLEEFVQYVEEFPPLVELSMIEKIREKGHLYFTEEQMDRLNKALDETTAL